MQDVKLVFNRNIDWYTNVRRCTNLEITQSTNSKLYLFVCLLVCLLVCLFVCLFV